MIKSVVSDKYRQLCNDSTPVTDNLLGDDLDKQKLIKHLDDMRKVGKNLIKHRAEKRKFKGRDNYDKDRKFPRYTTYAGFRTKEKAT